MKMKMPFYNAYKNNIITNIINKSLISLPTPNNLSFMWNFGSIMGLFLLIQIISGLMLTMHYCPNENLAFYSIIHILKDIDKGWLLRNIHMNGASFYFLIMYMHIGRNIYYMCYSSNKTWNIGVTILILSMATAFMGYILPWGQMSFWGATVITNLLSAIPYMGTTIVEWIWGGFAINNATLNRFFTFHFIMPFIILFFVLMHLLFLHINGSNNPLGINDKNMKIPFHPYYSIKDLLGFMIILLIFFYFIYQNPYFFSDPDNFIEANSMNTPIHIKPEWYFLFAYSILRTISNKLGGVIALLMSLLILFIMPLMLNNQLKTNKFYFMNQMYFWFFINNFMLLTWLGIQPIEYPFKSLSYIFTMTYFSFYILNPILFKLWDKMIFNK
uniref:Cytochrome b n=2 Tax=Apoidea TaxID=34735 RepID=A0A7T5BMH9_9HYME|nr:cytochrome b [Euaspis polynesia]QQD78167.1 cytochrome b [Euaspis polynesia]